MIPPGFALSSAMHLKSRSWVVIAVTLAALTSAGCPYYNTFYNARNAFRQAEAIRKEARTKDGTIPQQARGLYELAIENAGLVVRDHAQSKWVDDALVLLGDVFLIQHDYSKAARKFEEVITNYPESDWVPYCTYSLGQASLSAGDTAHAEATLQAFLQGFPNSKWSSDALLLSAAITLAQHDFEQTTGLYAKFLDSYPNHDRRAEAQYHMSEAYMALNRFGDARTLLVQVGKNARTADLKFQANYTIGESLRRDKLYAEALKTFQGLLNVSTYLPYYPKIMLAVAASLDALGRSEDAIKQYKSIVEKYEKELNASDEVAQSLFALGGILERQGELTVAQEYYGQAQKKSPRNLWVAKRAEEKNQDLHDLQKYRENLDEAQKALIPPDSTHAGAMADYKLSERLVAARFQLAEHYLFQFQRADSALVQYRQIVSDAILPEVAAKAIYASAWIQQNIVGDTLSSRADYEALIKRFRKTTYASEAAIVLSEPDPNGLSLEKSFAVAESLLFKAQQPDSAVAHYYWILDRYPQGEIASRALWAVGWTAETYQALPDSAIAVYRRIKEEYPKSIHAKAAALKIRYAEELFAELRGDAPSKPDSQAVRLSSDAVQEKPGPSVSRTVPPVLDQISRVDSQGTLGSILNRNLIVNLTAGQQVKNGDAGFVFMTETRDGKEVALKLADIQVVNADSHVGQTGSISVETGLMDKPGGTPVLSLEAGTNVDVLAEQGEWVKVRIDSQEGFVEKTVIIPAETQTQTAACRITKSYGPLNQNAWLGVRFDRDEKELKP